MDHYKVFTWTPDKERYPDPEKMIADLAKDGIKIITIIDPGVKLEEGYSVYDKGVENGYFATTPEGEIYVNAVWPGDAVYPDFGKKEVRDWWGENQQFLVDKGVRGVWNDMNEPASFRGELPQDVVFTDEDEKSDHARMHNVHGKGNLRGLKAAGRQTSVCHHESLLCRHAEIQHRMDRRQSQHLGASADGDPAAVQPWYERNVLCRYRRGRFRFGLYKRADVSLGRGWMLLSVIPESFRNRNTVSGALEIRSGNRGYLPESSAASISSDSVLL